MDTLDDLIAKRNDIASRLELQLHESRTLHWNMPKGRPKTWKMKVDEADATVNASRDELRDLDNHIKELATPFDNDKEQ